MRAEGNTRTTEVRHVLEGGGQLPAAVQLVTVKVELAEVKARPGQDEVAVRGKVNSYIYYRTHRGQVTGQGVQIPFATVVPFPGIGPEDAVEVAVRDLRHEERLEPFDQSFHQRIDMLISVSAPEPTATEAKATTAETAEPPLAGGQGPPVSGSEAGSPAPAGTAPSPPPSAPESTWPPADMPTLTAAPIARRLEPSEPVTTLLDRLEALLNTLDTLQQRLGPLTDSLATLAQESGRAAPPGDGVTLPWPQEPDLPSLWEQSLADLRAGLARYEGRLEAMHAVWAQVGEALAALETRLAAVPAVGLVERLERAVEALAEEVAALQAWRQSWRTANGGQHMEGRELGEASLLSPEATEEATGIAGEPVTSSMEPTLASPGQPAAVAEKGPAPEPAEVAPRSPRVLVWKAFPKD